MPPHTNGDVTKAIERRQRILKRVKADSEGVITELCIKMRTTCEEMDGMKDDIGVIREDVADIKEQQHGLIDLLTEHVNHHPKLRQRMSPPLSWKEKVLEAKVAIAVAVLGVVGSVCGAAIVVIFT